MPRGIKSAPPQQASLNDLWGKKKAKESVATKAEPKERSVSNEPTRSSESLYYVIFLLVLPDHPDDSRPTKKRRVVDSDGEDAVAKDRPSMWPVVDV